MASDLEKRGILDGVKVAELKSRILDEDAEVFELINEYSQKTGR